MCFILLSHHWSRFIFIYTHLHGEKSSSLIILRDISTNQILSRLHFSMDATRSWATLSFERFLLLSNKQLQIVSTSRLENISWWRLQTTPDVSRHFEKLTMPYFFRIAVELASKIAKYFETMSLNLTEGLIKCQIESNPINPVVTSSLLRWFAQQDINTSYVLWLK